MITGVGAMVSDLGKMRAGVAVGFQPHSLSMYLWYCIGEAAGQCGTDQQGIWMAIVVIMRIVPRPAILLGQTD